MSTLPADPDVLVVGGGPAGLGAAMILGRACRSVLLVDAGEPVNAAAPAMHGVLGFDGAPVPELAARARTELAAYDVTLADGRVTALEPPPTPDARWQATLDDGRTVRPAAVVLAPGVQLELPPLDGLTELWGVRAATCPFCHGWEVRDRPLLAIGASVEVTEHLLAILAGWSDDVTPVVPAPGDRLDALAGSDTGVVLHRADGRRHEAAFAFVGAPPRATVRDLLAPDTATVEPFGSPATDRWGTIDASTGLFGAGMAVDPMANVTMAAASGMRAGVAANAWLASRAGHAVHLPA